MGGFSVAAREWHPGFGFRPQRDGSEPGTRAGRPGRPIGRERIRLLPDRPRLPSGCSLLPLGLFLRLGRGFNLGEVRLRLGGRARFRGGRRDPGRTCVVHDRLGRRPVGGDSGIRGDARLHHPVEADGKSQVRAEDDSDARGQSVIPELARPLHKPVPTQGYPPLRP